MKVKFIKLSEDHLEMVRNWRNQPKVSKYMYTNDNITEKQQSDWFKKIKNDSSKKYWIVEVDGQKVGVVNLMNINRRNKRCYWAYYLADPSIRGKGLGGLIELNILRYVFEVLGLNKLCCEILSSNQMVVKIHQKYGSKIEGTFRQHVFKDNQFHDIICMAILKKEWKEVSQTFNFEKIDIE